MKNSNNNNTFKQSPQKGGESESGAVLKNGPAPGGPGGGPGQGPKISPKELILLGIVAASFIAIHFLYPPQARAVYDVSLSYLQEMALIIPPVFILMGLFEVWVPKSFIQKYMGKKAGIKGIGLAFVFGTIPTGPVYIAFPIAAAMHRKGARVMNITVFLGTWAAAKLPQLMVELKFLGPSFTGLRFVLTVLSVIIIGIVVEKIITKNESRELFQEAR